MRWCQRDERLPRELQRVTAEQTRGWTRPSQRLAAHPRRKFFDLRTSGKAPIAEEALRPIGGLYDIEKAVAGSRQMCAKRGTNVVARLRSQLCGYGWKTTLNACRKSPGRRKRSAMHCPVGTCFASFLDDGTIDNNAAERAIRPIALGRENWLFAGSNKGGERAAAILSLIQAAKLNGFDPEAYLRDILICRALPEMASRSLGTITVGISFAAKPATSTNWNHRSSCCNDEQRFSPEFQFQRPAQHHHNDRIHL